MRQRIRFCSTPAGHVAYSVMGDGPYLVCDTGWVSHLEHMLEIAAVAGFFGALAERFSVVRFDKLGSGLSDKPDATVSFDGQVSTLLAVADSVGAERFHVFGASHTASGTCYLYGCTDAPVFFNDRDGVLAAGTTYEPRLLTTPDGGVTWNVRRLPGNLPMNLNFVDGDHGWATPGLTGQAFQLITDMANEVPLYRTEDGGVTWRSVANNLSQKIPAVQPDQHRFSTLYKLYFVDRENGFASSTTNEVPTLLKTMDGGQTWSVVCVQIDWTVAKGSSHCAT